MIHTLLISSSYLLGQSSRHGGRKVVIIDTDHLWGIRGDQKLAKRGGRHGAILNLPKWICVRGVSDVPLSHTARKSPGTTSMSVG